MAPAVGTPASASIPTARNASTGSGSPGLRVPRSARNFARQAIVSPGPKSGQPFATDRASVPSAGASSSAVSLDDEARPVRGLLGSVDDDRLDRPRLVGFDGCGERGSERRHPGRPLSQHASQGEEQERPGERSAPPHAQRRDGDEGHGGRGSPAGHAARRERVSDGEGQGPGDQTHPPSSESGALGCALGIGQGFS